ncbi:MAG: sn-glycerol-3-phosphate ABC transporter ATP-binding protein UgpC [Clostridium sp.]|uniref:ABC transporter ATP-binding protein n=1 Tax=Clostridium sp. TaxID=1506 RepID=UPI002FC798E0
MSTLTLQNISKEYKNSSKAVDNVNINIENKEFLVLVGPSGCGKSTTLRMIAGLEEPTEGTIHIDNRDVTNIEPKDRDIAMVFQNYALYPHMSVFDNLAFSLKVKKLSKSEINSKVEQTAAKLQLTEYLKRKPGQLSGGQRQRVALGRAIIRQPKLYLMDEPLSNLDAKLRVQMRAEIIKLYNEANASVVYVTHDQTEAMTMGSRIVVMNNGVIQQVDTPHNIYNNPANLFVAAFIGSPQMNFFECKVVEENSNIKLLLNNQHLEIPDETASLLSSKGYVNKSVKIGIRPEHVIYEDESSKNKISTKVEFVEMLGHETFVYTIYNDNRVALLVDPSVMLLPNQNISINLDTRKLHIFDIETEKNIRL